jgi:membrane fusion protein, multidrug efflux system
MKRNIRVGYVILGVIIIVAALASPRFRQLFSSSGGGKRGENGLNRVVVSAVVVKPEPLSNSVRATGTVLANEELDLRSEIAGKISKILFVEGGSVRKGDLLVKIDDSELQAERAKLESQRKVVQEKERRRRQLRDKQGISPEDYEIVENELNAVNAEIQLIEAKIRKTELRAPFDGLIGLRYTSEGSYVGPELRIVGLQDLSKVKLDFSVPEKYVRAVKKGQGVWFRIAGDETRYAGTIYAVEPKIDPVTRNVLLRAIARNDRQRITPGAFAEVELELERIDDALLVPTEALVPDLQGQKVYVARGGICQESRVTIGLRTEGKVQVTSGVQVGDTVLTSGLLQVVPGIAVTLKEVR